MPDRPISPLMYEAEAARLIGIEPRALRSERIAGRIGYRRVAGRIMYGADDIDEWTGSIKETLAHAKPGPEHPQVRVAKSLARWRAFKDRKHATGFIYFIMAGEEFVKIGYSVKPALRLGFMQTGCPLPLRVIGTSPGTIDEEKSLHKRFSPYRLRGEWFRCDGELLAFIKTLEAIDG